MSKQEGGEWSRCTANSEDGRITGTLKRGYKESFVSSKRLASAPSHVNRVSGDVEAMSDNNKSDRHRRRDQRQRCRQMATGSTRKITNIDSLPFGGTCASRGCDSQKKLIAATKQVDLVDFRHSAELIETVYRRSRDWLERPTSILSRGT
jgi:hypothetical protein